MGNGINNAAKCGVELVKSIFNHHIFPIHKINTKDKTIAAPKENKIRTKDTIIAPVIIKIYFQSNY